MKVVSEVSIFVCLSNHGSASEHRSFYYVYYKDGDDWACYPCSGSIHFKSFYSFIVLGYNLVEFIACHAVPVFLYKIF